VPKAQIKAATQQKLSTDVSQYLITTMTVTSQSILFVDDHNLVASGISGLLREHSHDVVTANSLVQARSALEKRRFDLLLLDINLADENGLSLLEAPPARLPPRVILLSGISEQEWIFRGFELGAFGFIPKSVEPEELLSAMDIMLTHSALSEGGWVWDTQRKAVVSADLCFPKETILTHKEREVFMHMREGKLDKQIADIMGLSIHTVRVHIRAIKRKRGHNRRLEQAF
jgi:DNA-binding NarL/FixJ family response regulator